MKMHSTLSPAQTQKTLNVISKANRRYLKRFSGEPLNRQPVHTVYGGAQLFKADTVTKLGALALAHFQRYAPDADTLGRVLGISDDGSLMNKVYQRIEEKLRREAVEDFRIDFEDGYGIRPHAEEDAAAAFVATEAARGMAEKTLPPNFGIRIKDFSEELKSRAIRTLDIFLTTLSKKSGAQLPAGFVVTLPKVVIPEQVAALVELFNVFEQKKLFKKNSLKLEFMIESPHAIINATGECSMPAFLNAAEGRCVAAHFGTYDYTAANNITSAHQSMDHPLCEFAKHMMKMALTDTGIWLSDGATNVMPVGPHRAAAGDKLTPDQEAENQEVVHRAWKLSYDNVRHSLKGGFYQGWDLHPGQIPMRYAACYLFFLEGLEAASLRLKNFIAHAAQATLVGDIFDDAASGQGLLNYFLRALNCGAITSEEILATGLTLEEVQGRSFIKILEGRKLRAKKS